jgi:hypothetical protein
MAEPLPPSKLEAFLLAVTALYLQGDMDKMRHPLQSHEQSWCQVFWIGALQTVTELFDMDKEGKYMRELCL